MIKKIFINILFLILLFVPLSSIAQEVESSQEVEYAPAIVQKILYESNNVTLKDAFGSDQKNQLLEVKITNGKYKGKTLQVENQQTSNPAYNIWLKQGDRIILDIEKEGDSFMAFVSDKQRTPALLLLTGLFFLSLLWVGGLKGLNSLISIVITATLVFFVLIPLILNGYPVILVSIVVSVLSTLATMFIVGGINLKSLSATIGTILSLCLAGILSIIIIKLASLSGLSGQNAVILWASRPDLDFTGILISAMIIASLGAVMDVGMSIASCIDQIKQHNPDLSRQKLIDSGISVGRDIIGTMSNTLILAYIGSAFPLLLLASEAPFIKFINLNTVATEISAALVGSIGIIACVPITTLICSFLYTYDFKRKKVKILFR